MKKNHKCYFPQECVGFEDFISKSDKLTQGNTWIYRGQQCACWELKTTLERAYEQFNIDGDNRIKVEKNMIREFQRRLYQYTANIPSDSSIDEWLALMQNYGAPTRLLDFTYSPYVAAYFAFEKAIACSTVAIWAINTNLFEDYLKQNKPKIYHDYDIYRFNRRQNQSIFYKIFIQKNIKDGKAKYKSPRGNLILPVNPFRLNDRLAYQRGVFLCPVNVTRGFMDNMSAYVGYENLKEKVIKFTVLIDEKNEKTIEALKALDDMNINRIILFPGLDGFAQSFAPRIHPLFLFQGDYDIDSL
jgi:hypothetical protein